MPILDLKATHKPVREYYSSLKQMQKLGVSHELAVKDSLADLLKYCCSKFNWSLIQEPSIKVNNKYIRPDGVIIRQDTLKHGYWEAKDNQDDLAKEVKQKLALGYPKDNIMFWSPSQIILYQNNREVFAENIETPESLVIAIKLFFEYTKPEIESWDIAAVEFGVNVKGLAEGLLKLIASAKKTNPTFRAALGDFTDLCRQSINPNISDKAVEEMLIQHLLTERIFRKLFDNPDFVIRNVIAAEIEKVIAALTSLSFNRDSFLGNLDYFYKALELAASTVEDFSEKQSFLNRVYERFFQSFSVKVADTHGIVYTPQEIVNFMVASVEEILKREFSTSLSNPDIHILDPFVGTGNFILRVMRELKKTALPYKYRHELHCNEVMLLPYYIAAMNIEHEYYNLTGSYRPFEGICLVDSFELAEDRQLSLFTPENTARVERQKKSPIFVIIGNPPYNAGQVNENDNNKNRKYPVIDSFVSQTYARDSNASNKNALSDPYVKAIRLASNRLGDNGIVALVTNNSFINDIAFDGMRQHLQRDFDIIYIFDLGGNVRKNPLLSGTTHNVFGIQVGVSINIFVRKSGNKSQPATIYYSRFDEQWTRYQKLDYLKQKQSIVNLDWQQITPDSKQTWLTEGLRDEFDSFIPIGNKEAKAANILNPEGVIFKLFSNGVKTNRDAWVYNFDQETLAINSQKMIDNYNQEVYKWQSKNLTPPIDEFINTDETEISWSESLKNYLVRSIKLKYEVSSTKLSLYRPFSSYYLYFNKYLNERCYKLPSIFPTPESEKENQVICVSGIGSSKPFQCLAVAFIPCLDMLEKTQCFPYYTYTYQGTNRQENITDWALNQFQSNYQDTTISKWDIFYYIYAVLHHHDYRSRYAANLKRELPRIPFASDFWGFANAGKRLADIHINYLSQKEYPLVFVENASEPLNWRVEKMRLSKDNTQIIYNSFLSLAGIPPEVFEYRLGNRSALEWIIEQYQVTTDRRSGIKNDPNRDDDPQYIIKLIGKIITVSRETVEIVKNLPACM